MTDTLKALKIAYIFIVTGIVYVAFIPAFSKRCRNSAVTLGLMNSFAGGVFLAMAFVHILPEAVETYNESMKSEHAEETDGRRLNSSSSSGEDHEAEHGHGHGDHIFPLPYVLFFLGYAVILLVDRVFSAHFGDSHSHGHGHSHSHEEEEDNDNE